MNAETLFDAVTLIDSDLIDEAGRYIPRRKRSVPWREWASLAACMVLAVGAGLFVLPMMRCGSGAPADSGSASGGSGMNGGAAPGSSGDTGFSTILNGEEDGSGGGSSFMSYAGPILPLTALDGAENVTAEREIILDFLPWTDESGPYAVSTDILVTDSYALTNPTEDAAAVTVLYPFVSSLWELEERQPVLTSGGETVAAALHAGAYTGTVTSWNMNDLNSWEEYAALLEDGGYQARALENFPDLSGTPVIVYEFTDSVPNTCASFTLDRSKTTVLSCGFLSFGKDGGDPVESLRLGFSAPQSYSPWKGEPDYLLVLGEDISELTIRNDSGRFDYPIEDGASIRRYETDLESALRTAAERMYRTDAWWSEIPGRARPDFELYFGLMKEFLLSYGPLAGDGGIARYETGWLAEVDFATADRVFYLEAEMTIPAGGSVELTAQTRKPASYNYYGVYPEIQGIYGYDLAAQLGSTLTFTSQTVTLEDQAIIKIVRQNFGFDLERGTTAVELDPGSEHFYLEVRRQARE